MIKLSAILLILCSCDSSGSVSNVEDASVTTEESFDASCDASIELSVCYTTCLFQGKEARCEGICSAGTCRVAR